MQVYLWCDSSTENCYFHLSNLVANDLVDDPDTETVVGDYHVQGNLGQANPVHADPEQASTFQADSGQVNPFQASPEQANPVQADPFLANSFPIEHFQIEPVQMQVEVTLSGGTV